MENLDCWLIHRWQSQEFSHAEKKIHYLYYNARVAQNSLFHYISTWVRRSDMTMKYKNVQRGRAEGTCDIQCSKKMNFKKNYFFNFGGLDKPSARFASPCTALPDEREQERGVAKERWNNWPLA